MLDILAVLITAIQLFVLFLVLGLTIVMAMAGLYLASEEVRETVHDFEMWAAHRRLKRRMRNENVYEHSDDPEIMELVFEQSQYYPSIFDAVVADHGDPRSILRAEKAQNARDHETLDRATEYHNGITE